MVISVRPAAADDAGRIAEIHVASWRDTYAHVLSAELLAGLSVERRTALWSRQINEGQSIHVAELDGVVVGFAAVGPGRGDDAPRELELTSIYERPEVHGTGTGQALLDAALGDKPAFLWVAEENPRARAFYRKNHFEPDGARTVNANLENLAEIRMVR